MKNKILLLLFFGFYSFLFSQNMNSIVELGYPKLLVQNNYSLEQKSSGNKKQNQTIINIYGEVLKIGFIDNYPQQIPIGKSMTNFTAKKISDLEFRIEKNDKVLKDWSNAVSYSNMSKQKASEFKVREYYDIFEDTLINGDILKILIRKIGDSNNYELIFRKKYDDEVPFIVSSLHSYSPTTLEKFIHNALEQKSKINYNFHQDWPSLYSAKFKKPITKVDEDTKIAVFFRPQNINNTKNMLEYRLVENTNSTENWQKADDVVILSNFKSNKKFYLQVRYPGGKKYIQEEYFSDPKWYETLWAKLVFGVLLLALLSSVFLFFKNIRTKKLQKEHQAKLQTLSAQLNPHFVFNALNSIQGLITSGNIEKSNQYLTEFSKLMRNIVDFGQKNFIPLSLEIKGLNHYISLEQLRFPFQYEFYLDKEITAEITEVLPMLCQPIIENSIKHGVSHLGDKGKVCLKIYKKHNDLVYEITDNGNGFNINEISKGTGIKLTEERIAIFNTTSKFVKILLKTENHHNEMKTVVTYKNRFAND